MGPGRSGWTESGCGWTLSPWTRRRAELGSLWPGPTVLSNCPVLAWLLPGAQRAENCWGDAVLFVCICPPGFFFFCLISVVSNSHEMTIKGFYNEKKVTFIGLVS